MGGFFVIWDVELVVRKVSEMLLFGADVIYELINMVQVLLVTTSVDFFKWNQMNLRVELDVWAFFDYYYDDFL